MQIVSIGDNLHEMSNSVLDNLHEMSNSVFQIKIRKIAPVLAEFDEGVVKVNVAWKKIYSSK